MRTVWSIINRTPRELLKEIILIDDASDREWLGKKLDDYVTTLAVPTFVIRCAVRRGVVNARLLGVKQATVKWNSLEYLKENEKISSTFNA